MVEDVCSYLKIFLLKRSHFCRRKAPPPNLGASSIISRARFKQQSSNVHKETRCTDVYNQTDSWHGNARQRRIEVSSFESMRCIDAIWCIEYQSPKWDILFIDFVLKCSSPFKPYKCFHINIHFHGNACSNQCKRQVQVCSMFEPFTYIRHCLFSPVVNLQREWSRGCFQSFS